MSESKLLLVLRADRWFHRQASKQAGKRTSWSSRSERVLAEKQTGRQASKQASRQAGKASRQVQH